MQQLRACNHAAGVLTGSVHRHCQSGKTRGQGLSRGCPLSTYHPNEPCAANVLSLVCSFLAPTTGAPLTTRAELHRGRDCMTF